MTTSRIERRLPEILTEISLPQVPDYLDDILDRTARSRQRPGWTLLERWLPMDIAVTPVRTGGVPWRTIGAVALLVLVAAAAAIYIGSQPSRAPFFGPAANGSIIYARDGDIFAADAGAARERLLIGGETNDHTVVISRDGGTVFFGRDVPGGSAVMAADADGHDVRQVSGTIVGATDGLGLSPDGRSLAVINASPQPQTLGVHDLSGAGGYRELRVPGIEPARYVGWRPPAGDEIIFEGHPGGDATQLGLYGIRPDGSGLREIALQRGESIKEPLRQVSFQGLTLSDDGAKAAYWNWEPSLNLEKSCYVHVLDLTTRRDRRMSFDPSSLCEVRAVFLTDNRILLEVEKVPAAGRARLLVAPADAHAAGRQVGPTWRPRRGRRGRCLRTAPWCC